MSKTPAGMMQELFTAMGLDPATLAEAGRRDLEALKALREHNTEGTATRALLEENIAFGEGLVRGLEGDQT